VKVKFIAAAEDAAKVKATLVANVKLTAMCK
jgi:hypothetical protein